MSRPRANPPRPAPRSLPLVALAAVLGVAGCSDEVETEYGRATGRSINGTNAFADLLRQRGHTIRPAVRYTESLGEWARVIVRFAPHPGPPDPAEALWLREWLDGGADRRLVYVVRDYTADAEFWARMLAALPADAPRADRDRLQARLDASRQATPTPPRPKVATEEGREWFATEPVDPKQPAAVAVAGRLEGPWAEGVDAGAAALPVRESIRAEEDDPVLLADDGRDLVVALAFRDEPAEGGDALIVANAAFLLNAGLLNRARRPLAARAADWLGDAPANVAFVEGSYVLHEGADSNVSPFHLLAVSPFNWVTAHLGAFGILLCLALAASIGRPRPEPPDSTERPSAHPIALGALLARTRQVAVAEDLIATYRRWRHPAAATHRAESTTPSPRRVPRA